MSRDRPTAVVFSSFCAAWRRAVWILRPRAADCNARKLARPGPRGPVSERELGGRAMPETNPAGGFRSTRLNAGLDRGRTPAPISRTSANGSRGGINPLRRCEPVSELDRLQVGVRGETSRHVARVDQLFIYDDIELTRLSGSNLNRPAAASLDPGLHTEGLGSVVSGSAVMDEDGHGHRLVGGNRFQYRTSAV